MPASTLLDAGCWPRVSDLIVFDFRFVCPVSLSAFIMSVNCCFSITAIFYLHSSATPAMFASEGLHYALAKFPLSSAEQTYTARESLTSSYCSHARNTHLQHTANLPLQLTRYTAYFELISNYTPVYRLYTTHHKHGRPRRTRTRWRPWARRLPWSWTR